MHQNLSQAGTNIKIQAICPSLGQVSIWEVLTIPDIRQREENDKVKTRKNAPRKRQIAKVSAKQRTFRAVLQRQRKQQRPSGEEAPNERAADLTEQAAGEVLSDTSRAFTVAQGKAKAAFRQKRQKAMAEQARKAPEAATSEAIENAMLPSPHSSTNAAHTIGRPDLATSHKSPSTARKERQKGSAAPKEKQALTPKTRQCRQQDAHKMARPTKTVMPAGRKTTAQRVTERARHSYQRKAQREMAQQTQKAARATAALTKRAAVATGKAVQAVMGLLAGLLGGVGLFLVFCVVILIAAIAASPFGIFFASDPEPDAVPLNVAVSQINMEYSGLLTELQEGDYDSIQLHGNPPDWREVVAVFASHTAGAEDGVDVATLDADRVERLRTTFWDMCSISSEEETIAHPDSNPNDEIDDIWTERILHITISAKTAEEMRTYYRFSDYQNEALNALLAEREAMSDLLGNLSISQKEALALLQNLPADLSPERKAVVRHALSLVGKVNYFWGGKSLVLGWDSRWGQLQLVWAEGSETTGTYRPYGLDCSGFVDWVFYNASGGTYVIGHGGGAYAQHTYCTDIPWSEAQPGDLVFYPEDEHVGIVGGRDESGNLLIIHCTSGSLNNVVITDTTGFIGLAEPDYYPDTH